MPTVYLAGSLQWWLDDGNGW